MELGIRRSSKLDGGIVDRTNLFVDLLSTEQNPPVAWSTPGIKNVNITVTDNDGAQSVSQLRVQVLNQLPGHNSRSGTQVQQAVQ